MANVSSSNGIEKQPKLRFPNFTEPYKLMEFSKYADVNPKCGKVPNSFYYIDLECVNAGEIKDLRIEMAETAPSRAQRLLTLYDILFQTVRPYQKNNYHFKVENDLPTVASTGYAVFRTEQSSEYLYELIHTERFLSDIMKRCTGTSFPAVSSSDIEDIAIWIPKFQEQKKIGDFLTLVDTKIAKQRLLIEHLKKYKRGLLDKLLEDNSTDANWHIVRLQDVANGFDYGINSAATTFDGVHKYIRITDIDDDSRQYLSDDIVSPSDTPEEKYRVSDNDILFARTGASVGKSYLYTPDDDALYFAGFLIRISVKKEYDSYFVYLNTLTSKYEKWLRLESMRSGQPGVNAEQYRNYAFRCPNYQTQVKIANIIKGIDSKILKERMSLSKLNSLKNGLLQQLFI